MDFETLDGNETTLKTHDTNPPTVSFETALRELEDTVQRLEAGDLPLEESLVLFERGVGSLKRCHAVLDQAEKRVRLLIKGADGSAVLEDVTPTGALSSGVTSAVAAPARKKSVKQSVDLEAATRQNMGPIQVSQSGKRSEASASEGLSPSESGHEESGLGGSLFGVSK